MHHWGRDVVGAALSILLMYALMVGLTAAIYSPRVGPDCPPGEVAVDVGRDHVWYGPLRVPARAFACEPLGPTQPCGETGCSSMEAP